MTPFRIGASVPEPLSRALRRVEAALVRRGPIPGEEEVAVVAGADEPGIAAGLPDGPRVIVPGIRGTRPAPWARALLGSASAVVLLDASEAAWVAGAVSCPIVVAGLPRPEDPPRRGEGIDTGGHEGLARLWEAEVGPVPTHGPGVAWVGGGGAAPIAAGLEAWAARRAVVALPGTRGRDILARGGALFARTSLEAIEATRLLCSARPLTAQLSARGRRSLSDLDRLDDVVDRFAEAVVLAAQGGR